VDTNSGSAVAANLRGIHYRIRKFLLEYDLQFVERTILLNRRAAMRRFPALAMNNRFALLHDLMPDERDSTAGAGIVVHFLHEENTCRRPTVAGICQSGVRLEA
jgi:hypothetical protein